MLGRPARLCVKASSLPGVGRGLTHRLQISLAALLEQSVHAAVEVLHAQSQELGNEVVGAATPGDASGASDDLDATLHRLLHVRVGLLAGEPIDCERSPDPMKYTSTPATVTRSGKFSIASISSSIRHTRVWRLASRA